MRWKLFYLHLHINKVLYLYTNVSKKNFTKEGI